MKEKKRKWKEAGTTKRFLPNFINEKKERSSLQCLSGAFIAKPPLQNTKKTKSKSYCKGQIGKKQKNVTKRSKRQKAGKVNSGMKGEQWQGVNSGRRQISQPEKFCRLRKFRNLAKFLLWSFFFCFLLLFPSGF